MPRRGKWTNAKAEWIDYHANLALLTTDDAAFWTGLQPANLAGKPPAEGDALQIIRWREGGSARSTWVVEVMRRQEPGP